MLLINTWNFFWNKFWALYNCTSDFIRVQENLEACGFRVIPVRWIVREGRHSFWPCFRACSKACSLALGMHSQIVNHNILQYNVMHNNWWNMAWGRQSGFFICRNIQSFYCILLFVACKILCVYTARWQNDVIYLYY